MRTSATALRKAIAAILVCTPLVSGCALKRAHDAGKQPVHATLSKVNGVLHGARRGQRRQRRPINLAAPSGGFQTAIQSAAPIVTSTFVDPLHVTYVPPPNAPPAISQPNYVPQNADAWAQLKNPALTLLQSEALGSVRQSGDVRARFAEDVALGGAVFNRGADIPGVAPEHILLHRIAMAFKDVRLNQQLLQNLHDSVATQQKSADLARKRLESGQSGRMDGLQIDGSIDVTKSQMPAARKELRNALTRLSVLVGMPMSAAKIRLIATDQQLSLPELDVRLPASVLRQRSDVQSAEHALVMTGSMQGIYEAALLPQLALKGELTAKQGASEDPSERDNLGFELGEQSTWSFADSDSTLSRDGATSSPLRSALKAYESTVYTAASEVEWLMTKYHRTLQEVRRLERAQGNAAEATRLALQQFEVDRLNVGQLINSHTRETEIGKTLATSRAGLAESAIALLHATGAGSNARQPPRSSFLGQ